MCSGVIPSLSYSSTIACSPKQRSNKCFNRASWRCMTAQCKADRRLPSTLPTLAPFNNNKHTTPSWPPIVAWISGVKPSLSFSLQSALCCRSRRTILSCPFCAAMCSGPNQLAFRWGCSDRLLTMGPKLSHSLRPLALSDCMEESRSVDLWRIRFPVSVGGCRAVIEVDFGSRSREYIFSISMKLMLLRCVWVPGILRPQKASGGSAAVSNDVENSADEVCGARDSSWVGRSEFRSVSLLKVWVWLWRWLIAFSWCLSIYHNNNVSYRYRSVTHVWSYEPRNRRCAMRFCARRRSIPIANNTSGLWA